MGRTEAPFKADGGTVSNDDWIESTEGDLDPDLTEEAGYAYWDPPRRRWAPLVMRGALVLMLLVLVVASVRVAIG